MKWKFWQRDNGPDIEFVDVTRSAYTIHPVVTAKSVRPHFHKHQLDEHDKYAFAHCPGMIDLKNYGYLIPAWDDIHIKANKAGCAAFVGGAGRRSMWQSPRNMLTAPADGIFKPEGIPLMVKHLGSPWSVKVRNKKISALVIPAFFHSPFLDDIYVYPGIVDYSDTFSTLNMIFSPKRECELTIKVGTPLLQVIPFIGGDIRAGYGPANEEDVHASKSVFSSSKQFYRKYVMNHDKSTTIEESDENIR